jgi:lysine-N-methylase
MLEHLRPQYAKAFRCLAARCEDNCCRTWEIPVDRDTDRQDERNPVLQPHLAEYFTLITEGACERRHALIQFTSSSTCPFLATERLCSLQQQYGADYLPETCVRYPRNPHRIDGLLEQPLSLSCIEAARLILLNPQLMPRTEAGPAVYARFRALAEEPVAGDSRQFRYFWDVREFCLLLVQDRSYPLWQRLFILGMFCRRLGEIVGTLQFQFVPKLLRDYAEMVCAADLRPVMDGIPIRVTAQVKMVVEVAFGYLRQHKLELCRNPRVPARLLAGCRLRPDAGLESCTDHYINAFANYYQPFMERHPYLLENYLINHIFRVVFPFGQVPEKGFEPPQREFLLMCVEFAVLKGLLIGMAGHCRDEFCVDHVVKLAQCLAKTWEHDATIGGALNWQGLSDSNCVAALLKN